MAVPRATTKFLICSDASIRSSRALSMFKILPRSGSIAWVFLSLPVLAVPPAESPSTIKSSDSSADLLWQSASLPGKVIPSKAPFLKIESLAALAALRARKAKTTLFMIALASSGFSSRNISKASPKTDSTIPRASTLPSLALVCPSNCISRSLTETTTVNPSKTSSPVKASSPFLVILFFLA